MVAVAGLVGSLGVLPAAAAEPFAAVGVWQDTEEWLYDAEGRQILLEVRPELTVGACFDYDPMGQVSAQFSLEGSDGQVVAGSTGAFAMETDGYGWWCGQTTWSADVDFHRGVTYETWSFPRVDGVAVGEPQWQGGLVVAGMPQAPELLSPEDGGTIDSNRPVLSVIAELAAWEYGEIDFLISGPGVVVLEGTVPATESGVVEWQVPQALGSGEYEWQVRSREFGGAFESEWSPARSFRVSPLDVPVPVSPTDGAGVTGDPVLSAEVTVGGRDAVRGVFQVLDSDGEMVLAEGASDWTHEDGLVSWTVPVWLDRGEYTWRVRTSDDASLSEWSPDRAFVMAYPPLRPEVLSFASVRAGATFRWYPAVASPDSPVIDYTLTASPGGHSVTVLADVLSGSYYEASLTGLAGGQSYTFSLTARNRWGSSTAATRTAWIAWPLSLAPEDITATTQGTTATVTWSPPSDTGGEEILGYRVVELPANVTVDLPAEQTTHTLTGLEYSAWYSVSVAAITSRGVGANGIVGFSPYTVPGAPTDLSVRRGDGFLEVSWSPPAHDGGSPVTGYVVTTFPGGVETVVGNVTHATVPGLVNDTEYTFTVAALNEAGTGPGSDSSSPRAPVSQWVDTDDDGVPDVLEEAAGSSVDLVDSDFDGLDDFAEVMHLTGVTSPTAPDTDGDGVGDAESDNDGDGLSNLVEVNQGTNPLRADTDGDGVSDSDELALGTDPLEADTDGDTLTDGDEVRLGTDPLLADSDGNGTADSDEQTSLVLEGEGVELAVAGTSASVLGAAWSVTGSTVAGAITSAVQVSAAVAEALDDGTGGSVDLSNLVFTVDPWVNLAGRELAVMAVNGSERATVTDGVHVSEGERTVTLASPEPGVTYQVVDLSEWRAQARTCDLAHSGSAPLDVELIIDARPTVISKDPAAEGLRVAREMLETLAPGDTVQFRYAKASVIMATHGHTIVGIVTPGEGTPLPGAGLQWVIEQLETATDTWWSNDGWFEGTVESNWLFPGFAERAFGDEFGWGDSDDPCRARTVILVTDGGLVPAPDEGIVDPGYAPFLERTSPPVHVIDVGDGEQWLQDTASRTAGTYTHVSTTVDTPDWDRDSEVPEPDPYDLFADDDGDGLSNWVETFGITPSTGHHEDIRRVFRSDPNNPDTDGDGIPDGVEAGQPVPISELDGWHSALPVTTYDVVSDPGRQDSDLDGLSDVDEIENGLNPLNPDIDGDGLKDGDEAHWGTDPTNPDTDADGYDDLHEVRYDEDGFDAHTPNIPIEAESWLQEFSLGALCGDTEVCRRPTMAWLTGNIASGVLVFGDVRDIIHSLRDGPGIHTAIIAAGLIPAGGDIAGAAGKVARVLPLATGSEARSMRRMLEGVTDSAGYIAKMREVDPTLIRLLEETGTSTNTMVKLLRNNDPVHLKRVLESSYLVRAADVGFEATTEFYDDWRDAERLLRTELMKRGPVDREPQFIGLIMPFLCGGCRLPDARLVLDSVVEFHESKVGFVRGIFAWKQFKKDIDLVLDNKAQAVVWHFFASGRTGKIGPSRILLEKMERLAADNGVVFKAVLHIPD